MKTRYITAIAAAALMLAGCQRESLAPDSGAQYDGIIRFAPNVGGIGNMTRGTLINTTGAEKALTEITEFTVSAWDNSATPVNIIPTGSKVVYRTPADQAPYWITVFGSGTHEGEDQKYLWKKDETKTFYAYANLPSTSGAASVTNTAATSQVLTYDVSLIPTDDLQTDILMAYYTNGSTPATSGLVPLTFYHPLTSVLFKQSATFQEGVSVKEISIVGVYASGKTEQSSATSAFTWTKTGGSALTKADATQTVSLQQPVTVDPDTKQIGTALLLIPQDFDADSESYIKVVLEDAADDSKTLDLYYLLNTNIGEESSPKYASWKAGYTNVYTISFNGSGLSIDGPDEYNGRPLGVSILRSQLQSIR